jgi:Ribosomal protein S1
MTEDKFATSMSEEGAEDFAAMLAAHDTASNRLQPGQKVTGTVIAITGDSVFVDVGIKVDGIIDRKDILDAEGNESVKPGDSLEAWVTGVSSQEIRLSRSMSGSGVAALEEARDAAVPVDGRITAVCKGGYTVDVLGKQAFCPGSQLGVATSEDAAEVVGRSMPFLVIRVENRGRNVVVSHRAIVERERAEQLDALLESLKPGDMVEGKITRFAAFGAFMELAPSVEGMIHLSELSWSRVGAPDEAVSLGDTVRAKVISISKDSKGHVRISLSRKQAEGDPWQDVTTRLESGTVVSGKVVRLAPLALLWSFCPVLKALCIFLNCRGQSAWPRPKTCLRRAKSFRLKIKEINLENHRISLSLRDAEGDPWKEAAQQFAVGSTVSGTVESRTPYGLFITLAPGITGLLPAGVIKNSKQGNQYSKLDKGDTVTLTVQNLDTSARRISLAPEGEQAAQPAEDKAWKQHTSAGSSNSGSGMNIMAQALQKALKNK